MKNRESKRARCLLLCMTLTAGLAAGCGGAGEASDTQEKEARQERDPDALTIANCNGMISLEFIEAFSEEHPEIRLEMASYAGMNGSGFARETLENGDLADIYVSTQNFSEESQEKYLLDLSGYDFVNNYSSGLLDNLEINGGIYLLPSGYQLSGIYYNKTILEEHGWAVPESFEELVALSEEIEAAGYQTVGHGMSLDGYPFNYFFNIGNTAYFGTPQGMEWKQDFPAGEATASGNRELEETIRYFNRWVEEGFITTGHMDTTQFYEGECVFFLCLGITQYAYTTEDGTTYEFGIMPWLSEDGNSNMLTRNVSGYLGINRELGEPGNEQKLQDALAFVEYASSAEGQQVMMAGSGYYMSSLNGSELSPENPYQEVAELVKAGRTVPLVYVGWEKQIVPIAQDIKLLIGKEITPEELPALFDQTNADLLNGSSRDVYAVAEETLTLEETARLVAIAEGKAVGADCAMVSMNEYHGNGLRNTQGLGWYLYQGEISTDEVNIIRVRSNTISLLELTGAEIRAMQEAGFDAEENGNPYRYLLVTRGDMELSDDETYTLAISTGEIPGEIAAKAVETEESPAEAIMAYLSEQKTIRADALSWE